MLPVAHELRNGHFIRPSAKPTGFLSGPSLSTGVLNNMPGVRHGKVHVFNYFSASGDTYCVAAIANLTPVPPKATCPTTLLVTINPNEHRRVRARPDHDAPAVRARSTDAVRGSISSTMPPTSHFAALAAPSVRSCG